MVLNLDLLSGMGGISDGYILAVTTFILVLLVLRVFKLIVLGKLKGLAAKTKTEVDNILVEAVEEIRWPLYFFLSLYVALQFTSAPDFIVRTVLYALIVVVTYYAIKLGQRLVDYGTRRIAEERLKEERTADVSLIKSMGGIVKVFLWVIAVLLILSNLGYNITALVAGLGIGGVAIALALQNILEDIFSSLSIYFDKPFVVGDFIIIGNDLGVVRKIGIKTTRIQHLQGQELVISNKELTSTRINNYGKMEKRRVAFNFGVLYETPVEKLKKIPAIVKKVIEDVELTTFDRAHFKEFGDFSLDFEVVYYVATSDYNRYMDVQQAINLGIKEAFEKEGIGFAYPTQTVYVDKKST